MPLKLSEVIAKTYGPAQGPFGFPMRDDVAREVDALVKGLPQECKDAGFVRVVTTEKAGEMNDDERSDVSYVTTDSVDRDMELVDPKGLDWSQFKKNPIVPFGHEYRALPVGRAAWWKRASQKIKDRDVSGWIGKTIYSKRPDDWASDWFPDAVWHMTKEGIICGKSIGFVPLEVKYPTPEEIKKRPELANVRRIWSKALVLEWSVAPVQSNPDAVVTEVGKMRQKGIAVPDSLLEELGVHMPDALEQIDWAALEGRAKGATAQPTPALQPPVDAPAFTTLSELKASLERQVLEQMGGISPAALVKEAMARRHGQL
jgi:hypothetical protein